METVNRELEKARRGEPGWKSPWVWTVIGLVAAVLGVNLVMVYFSVSGGPGLVVDDYYERGRSFVARTSPDFIKREKPEWKLDIALPQTLTLGVPALFKATVTGEKEGDPTSRVKAVLFAYRPSDAGRDFSVPMTDEGGGAHTARVLFPLKGVWDIIIEARSGEKKSSVAKRIFVAD